MAQDRKPRFEIDKLEGSYTHQIAKPTDTGGFEFEDVQVDKGWMVYFPTGASIHVRTEAEMVRQGFLKAPEIVDMETGDVIPENEPSSLKSLSEQKTKRTRSTRSTDATAS